MALRDKKAEIVQEKTRFVCKKCRYKFSIDTMRYSQIVCPWCGAIQPEGGG